MISIHLPSLTRRVNMTPVNYAHAFDMLKQYEFLTHNEQKLHDALLKVESESIWGKAIVNVFADYSIYKFRNLVSDLLSQMHDDELTMYKILGKEAFDALKFLKP